MEIIKKIATNKNNPQTTIAFLGDSVTEGCFRSHCDYKAAYHNVLKRKLEVFCPNSVINIINAGIGGTTADFGAERLERDVLSKNPDLCVVCFGLNDVGGLEERLHVYTESLEKIFTDLKNAGCEVIFMTPNMLNTAITDVIPPQYADYAKVTMEWQKNGLMDKYMNAAIETAEKNNIPVCDCYGKWKKLAELGVDTSNLLSNGINHPTREMHEFFANSLIETMLR